MSKPNDPPAAHQIRAVNEFYGRIGATLGATSKVIASRPPDWYENKAYLTALANAQAQSGWLHAMDPGSGKTRAGLMIVESLPRWATRVQTKYGLHPDLVAALGRPVLIVGKASGVHVWAREAHKWFGDGLPVAQITASKDIAPTLASAARGEVRAVSVSYSLIGRCADQFHELPWSLMICDEIQAITNPSTDRAQGVYAVSRMASDGVLNTLTRLGLSGTPQGDKVANLWAALAWLQGYPRKVRGNYRPVSTTWGTQTDFMLKYTRYGDVRSPTNLIHDPQRYALCRTHTEDRCDNLNPRMKRHIMTRVTAAEAWPNLPGITIDWLDVDMPAAQTSLYYRLVDEHLIPAYDAMRRERNVTISELALFTYGLEALTSTRQLAWSLRNKPDWQLATDGDYSGILDTVVELTDEIGEESVVIFTAWNQFADEIAAAIPDMKPLVLSGHGRLTPGEVEARFADVSLGHRAVVATTRGSEAISLTKARYVVLAGFVAWSPHVLIQAIHRIRRPGQTAEHLQVYALTAPGTLLRWLQGLHASKLEAAVEALDGARGGADELSIGHMSRDAFRSAFRGV